MGIKLLRKWLTVPTGILIVSLSGCALNLKERLSESADAAGEWVTMVFTLSVQLGYFSGILAGYLVDNMPNLVSYIIAAVLSFISFGGVAFILGQELTTGWIILTIFLLILAGLSASIATVTSIVSIAKNFDRQVAYLLVAIAIGYMKTAKAFDHSVKEGFFPDLDDQLYMIVVGLVVTLVNVIGAVVMRKVELGKVLTHLSKSADPFGVLIFIVVLGLYLMAFWVVVEALEEY